jgi:hypothetical protein
METTSATTATAMASLRKILRAIPNPKGSARDVSRIDVQRSQKTRVGSVKPFVRARTGAIMA